MNRGLRKELSTLAGLAAVATYPSRNKNWSYGLALTALTLRFWPLAQGYSYRHKTVVITGGSRGLGFALAEVLVSEGARVVLLARDPQELQDAKQKLEKTPQAQVCTIRCDVTEPNEVDRAFAEVREQFRRIDVLINNAGCVSAGPLRSMTKSDFKAQMDLHLYAVMTTTDAVKPFFREGRGGKIINISSIGGKVPMPHMSSYCASKFALAGYSRVATSELAPEGIEVTTVYPGLMRTGSPIQGVFKGDAEKEFAWFATADLLPGLSVSATHAARRILEGARFGEKEIIISLPAKVGALAESIFPEITARLLSFVNRLLPDGDSLERKTGASSQRLFQQSRWTWPLRKLGERAERQFNQKPKHDADFNLGLNQSRG